MHFGIEKKFTLHKINMNFPKVIVKYIKFMRNLRKQSVPNFILHKFTAIQTS